ncbi:MAG: Flp pilus assembly protein CpaB [Myxococcota bacterium]
MGRGSYSVDPRIQAIAWLTCISCAYQLTLPVYRLLHGLDSELARLSQPPSAESYLIATHTMQVGHVIQPEDLDWGQTPGFFPIGALQNATPFIGRSLKERVLAGDALRNERFSEHPGSGISALVPPGHRAVTLRLTTADRVSGFVEPGDRVDVLVTLYDNLRPTDTIPILQNVPVLTVNDELEKTPLGQPALKARVSLLTTPHDANRLTHALEYGLPRLVLRPEDDAGEVQPPPVAGPPALTDDRPAQAQGKQTRTLRRAQQAFRNFVTHRPLSVDQRALVEGVLRKVESR